MVLYIKGIGKIDYQIHPKYVPSARVPSPCDQKIKRQNIVCPVLQCRLLFNL